ncbi:MAG: flagellar export protein FliJ [Paludibacterium sp.]|uniref:flagellar export protein FliJ n=1 Tax=Paludibacterium sp. TaxID=1917523 RepID=UPI0025E4E24B|nr:flagellar export protein FliJ [Paludibacterium sp.]MBV8047821.1 flagellar export protein FliJ [Paludibacterium sp.]MBV8648713.1 flagellar export protein FliJ [Paludibacterium sp.]
MAHSKYALLLNLAQEKVDAAAERMRKAQASQVAAQGKLAQLKTFLQEYRQRLTDGGIRGMGIGQWQDFQRFLRRLDEAVEIQQGEVDRCMQRFMLERQAWHNERKKLKAYEKLMAREAVRLQRAENRRQQKSTDEFASRRFWDQTHSEE